MRLIDDIGGRSDDTFLYTGGVVAHSMLFRSPLGRQRNIVEYQVRQTAHAPRWSYAPMATFREYNVPLAEHFDRTIRTGTYCSYGPDPRAPGRSKV
jgi:hypothetical protein